VLLVTGRNVVGEGPPSHDLTAIRSLYGVSGLNGLAASFAWQPLSSATCPAISKVYVKQKQKQKQNVQRIDRVYHFFQIRSDPPS
jgi:hypothetical protein